MIWDIQRCLEATGNKDYSTAKRNETVNDNYFG